MSQATTELCVHFLTVLASAAVRSLVIGCVLAVILEAFGVKGVHVKMLIWRGVLAAALAMPFLTVLCPAIPFAVPLPDFGKHMANTEISLPQIATVHATSPESDATIAAPEKSASATGAISTNQPSDPAAVVRPADMSRQIAWPVIAALGYLAVALLFIARILIGMRVAHKLERSAHRITDTRALEAFSIAVRAAGLRREPALEESEMIPAPLMLGVRNPVILFPADWRRWDADELAAVLAHEVSHVRRHDALVRRLALIHRAVFWFNPLAWWVERQLEDLSEQASDEAALGGGADRTRYAEALLEFFAELEAAPRRTWWEAVSMAKAGQAEKRVERILAWRPAMSRKPARILVLALAVIAVPAVALTASLHPAVDDIQAQAPPAPPAPPAPSAPDPAAAASPAPPTAQAPAAAPAPEPPAPPAEDQEFHVVIPPMPAIPPLHIDVPPVNVDLPNLHVAVPQIHIETRALPAMPQQDFVVQPPMTLSMSGDWNFYRAWPGGYWVGRYYDWGPRFAIVTKESDDFMISGDREDAEHARELKRKMGGDFIWFERDEKSYIISDPATVNRAKQIWQPNEDLEKQQKELGRQQEELGKQAKEAARKFEDMKVKVPDLTAEMQKVEEAMRKLSAEGGTMEQLGDLQRQMGEIQREIGEAQRSVGTTAGEMGREQGEWGRKMGEIGRQQGDLGRKQAELARGASRQMQQLLDDAVSKGLAKPE
ncbi:MAG TPA: M56 family metallopeptidase [Candidatus Acidoferrales bacterium]|nr:M56 family metallopeptidase [Candidatus Acidoferrales bacterium]